jgi:hypothetical protein
MDHQGRQPAGECRSLQFQADGPGRAQPHRPRLRARPDETNRLYPARAGAGTPKPRTSAGSVRSGRRAAARSSSCPATAPSATACRSAPCPTCRRPSFPISTRPIPRSRAHPCPKSSCPPAAPCPRPRARATTAARHASSRPLARSAAPCAPPLGRAARWPALRLHAAGRAHRGLSRTDRRRRERRRRSAFPSISKAIAAAGRAHQRHPRRARSRRHRGQHPSRLQLAGLRRRPPRSTRRPARPGSAPTSS